jgi:DNA repair protein RecN (Recombination protein N)
VLTGETGAGKSILIDALQLALGGRGDVGVVREGASRAEIAAEFDNPPSLAGWLDEGGFDAGDALLLRRSIDSQGKSRAWINGSPAGCAAARSGRHRDIHGQHAWQSSRSQRAAARARPAGRRGHASRALRAEGCGPGSRANHRRDEIERGGSPRQISESSSRAALPSGTKLNAEHRAVACAGAGLGRRRAAAVESDTNAADHTDRELCRRPWRAGTRRSRR